MGTDVAEASKVPQNCCDVKIHSSICSELRSLMKTISLIIPDIESARPGCSSGIKALCALTNLIDKAKLLLQHCAESSKLYLAITGEATLLRCERIRSSCIQNLCQIQDVVPAAVASKIAGVLDKLRIAKFTMDSAEEEAGRALLHMLQQTDITEELEFEAFQIAALRLNLTSPKAILIERRLVQKLLDKLIVSDMKKEKILRYFLHLLKKHGKNVKQETSEHKDDGIAKCKISTSQANYRCTDNFSEKVDESSVLGGSLGVTNQPFCPPKEGGSSADISRTIVAPEEFCCPISSKLMYDPVVIASGQTYERRCIQKWFNEGHDTCPKTQKKLPNYNLIPNTTMKDLIAKWCGKTGIEVPEYYSEEPELNAGDFSSLESFQSHSISSLKNVCAALLDGSNRDYFLPNDHSNVSLISLDASYSSDLSHVKGFEVLNDNYGHLFSWSDDYQKYLSFSNFNHDMYMRFFYTLLERPVHEQKKAVEDVKIILDNDEEIYYAMLYNGFPEAITTFLKNAHNLSDLQAQKTGSQLFLAFLSNSRVEVSSLTEDACQLLISSLDSEITAEALTILQKLAHHPTYRSNVVASIVAPSITKILNLSNSELLELSLNILADLSSDEDLKAHFISLECITKLVSFLTDGRLAKFCLQVIRNVSDTEEGSGLIVTADGCVASVVELLDTGNDVEKEHAVAILHSVCSQSLENCLLVMAEGVIPALVETSVNGNDKGKEISLKLLHLLRDVRQTDSDSVDKPESRPELIDNVVDRSEKEQSISRSYGFVARRIRFFSKSSFLTHF